MNADEKVRDAGWQRESARRTFAVRALATLVLASGALAFAAYREAAELAAEIRLRTEREDARSERLGAKVRFDAARQQLVAGIREEVQSTHPKLEAEVGRRLAEIVVGTSEKYPRVDPLLLASVGIVDSRGALGTNPSTGTFYRMHAEAARRMADEMGWEYDRELLKSPARTAELAARHLDLLNRAYNDVEMVLAEYNGGPLNAGYLRARVGRLSAETRAYVPEVLEVYGRLGSNLGASSPRRTVSRIVTARTLGDAAGGKRPRPRSSSP